MPREIKSQWEFGELFPSTVTRKVLSVSELTLQVKRLLEQHVGAVWVTGEISTLRVQPSGHAYFTLKDAGAQLACVLFRGEAVANRDALQEGRKVNLHGDVTVYEARGQYQLRVTEIELEGIGALQAAFERLKQKLAAEGLFAAERKRPLPRFPRRIGVVPSRSGAAIHDIIRTVQRRLPAPLLIADAAVQGQTAANQIVMGMAMVVRAGVDVVIVGRGGGAATDLTAFNHERVVGTIARCPVPVISAVAHEIDLSLADLAADARASTPTAAAELAVPDGAALADQLGKERRRLDREFRHPPPRARPGPGP